MLYLEQEEYPLQCNITTAKDMMLPVLEKTAVDLLA